MQYGKVKKGVNGVPSQKISIPGLLYGIIQNRNTNMVIHSISRWNVWWTEVISDEHNTQSTLDIAS